MSKKEKIAGWANFPVVESEVSRPSRLADFQKIVAEKKPLSVRGNGRAYGDAGLFERTISTGNWRKMLAFDAKTGLLTAQSGILVHQIIDFAVPRGWFFAVVPGHQFVSLGGCIAADVHGKNHPRVGSFSNFLVSFELLTADGAVVFCSKTENEKLFWRTVGGMGWTGAILSATIRLRKISTPFLNQKTEKSHSLAHLFELFEQNENQEYRAAWLDCLRPDARGNLFSADHLEAENADDLARFERKKLRNVPFFAPNGLLNPLTISVFNRFFWRAKKAGEQKVGLEPFFFPLDALGNWNRFYGRRGFVQYQIGAPEVTAFSLISGILEEIQRAKMPPFLTVLKKLGNQPPEARNSFPIRGWTLALDFPMRDGLLPFLKKLDERVLEADGKIYLAKDAVSDPRLARINGGDFADETFTSLQKKRLFG